MVMVMVIAMSVAAPLSFPKLFCYPSSQPRIPRKQPYLTSSSVSSLLASSYLSHTTAISLNEFGATLFVEPIIIRYPPNSDVLDINCPPTLDNHTLSLITPFRTLVQFCA
ncbi:hypothetical protein ACMFMG_007477 [Clarireedia jacksonii]